MKQTVRNIALCVLLGAAGSAQAAVNLVDNGDFSTPGGVDWGQAASAGTLITFETANGADGPADGFGKIDNTAGAWGGVLVSPPTDPGTPLGDLGLVAGETYEFSMDIIRFGGTTETGGIKFESWNAGGILSNSGDLAASGASNTWETYSWNYTVDPAATHIKIVPLVTGTAGGGNGSFGFDNVRVDDTPVPFVPDQILNCDFEIPGGANWGTTQGTPLFPTANGNPDGHAVLDGTAGFAVLYAFDNTEKTFASLGLSPGETYVIQLDMKIISGGSIGGIRLEGPSGYVVESYPTLIGDGSTWETYEIELTVPADPIQAKFGLRPGGSSIVGFDNVKIVVPLEVPFTAFIDQGTVVSWTASNADNTYQAQESTDNSTWVDLGPLFTGTTGTNSVFDADGSPFYQVVETTPDITDNSVLNGGFEITEAATYPSPGAQDWVIQSPEDTDPADGTATMTNETSYLRASDSMTFNPFEGTQMLVIESTTPVSGPVVPPNTNVASVQFFVDPSTDLDVSFMAAHVIKNGGANPQFQVVFFDDGGGGPPNFISSSGFQSFASIGETWTKVEFPVTTPANASWMTIEFIQAMGAGNGWQWVTLIDDVSIPYVVTPGMSSTIAPAANPGVEVSFPTASGETYQVKSSTTGMNFMDFGAAITGDGNTQSVFDTVVPPGNLYRVVEGTN